MAIATLPYIGGPEVEDVPWPRPVLTLVRSVGRPEVADLAPIRELYPSRPRQGVDVATRRAARQSSRLGRRRLTLGFLGLVVAVGLALPLTSIGTVTVSGQPTPGGSTAGLADGSIYVVQPGDSLAGIADRINPARQGQLVHQMAQEVGSSTVVAGEHIALP